MRAGSSRVVWDGASLARGLGVHGRRLRADPRCFAGTPVAGAFAHVCALTDDAAALPFDDLAVQQARRDVLGWWIPLLGSSLVCVTTLAVDSVHCAGAITVTRGPAPFPDDPFARVFPGTVVRTDLFSEVPPPAGPVTERVAGAAWPGGAFATTG